MAYHRLTALIFLLTCNIAWADQPCAISLTYKDIGKPGYMDRAPSNEGLYKALYTELSQKINCTLTIKRYPKKRTHKMLKYGEVDLYPSTGFDNERSEYLFYIPNGLHRHEPYFGLTPKRVTELNSIKEIQTKNLIWIFEAGNTTAEFAYSLDIPYQEIVGLTYVKAINILKYERNVFYRIIEKDYNTYLADNNLDDLSSLKITTHKYCCKPKSQTLYLGISRSSNIIEEEPNPNYNPQQTLSPENFPTRLVKGSISEKISTALQKMQESGKTTALYRQYILKTP